MDNISFKGKYEITCVRNGDVLWTDRIDNLVPVEGRDAILASALKGSAYTAECVMGLIAYGLSAPVATDTMVSHGFIEAGINAPTFATRQVITFGTVSNGMVATSTPASFTITTTGGTVKGCFIAMNGATVTIEDTAGALLSAGYFVGGDRTVAPSDILQVTYSMTAVGN
jgi:hypothetical protein